MAFFDHYSSSQSTPLGREFLKKAARLLCSSVKKVHPAAESVLKNGGLWLQRRYKLRTTSLWNFLIIGRKA